MGHLLKLNAHRDAYLHMPKLALTETKRITVRLFFKGDLSLCCDTLPLTIGKRKKMASKNRGLSDGSCPGFEWKYHLFPIPSYMHETLSCLHCNKIFKLPYYTVKYEHWPSFFVVVYFENMEKMHF